MKENINILKWIGGKQKMLSKIIPLIPNDKLYVEAYAGGGSVFWNKKLATNNVINDLDDNVINFYKVLKNKFNEFDKLLQEVLYSRSVFNKCLDDFRNKKGDDVSGAFGFWYISNFCFIDNRCFSVGNGGEGCEKKLTKLKSKIKDHVKKLENTVIEKKDAMEIIKYFDAENVFFYLDPPYAETIKVYKNNYSNKNIIELLKVLEKIKGKFMLSHYYNENIKEYANKNNWVYKEYKMKIEGSKNKKEKIEVLVMNYEIKNDLGLC